MNFAPWEANGLPGCSPLRGPAPGKAKSRTKAKDFQFHSCRIQEVEEGHTRGTASMPPATPTESRDLAHC